MSIKGKQVTEWRSKRDIVRDIHGGDGMQHKEKELCFSRDHSDVGKVNQEAQPDEIGIFKKPK